MAYYTGATRGPLVFFLTILRTREARRRPRGKLAGRAGSSATRGRRRRRGVADFLVRDGWLVRSARRGGGRRPH